MKESIILDDKNAKNYGVWNSFSNQFSSLKNYLKYNIISNNSRVKFNQLPYLIIFGKDFSPHQMKGEDFPLCLSKIIRITYRSNFASLFDSNGNAFNSDCDWGCMIRASQMMLAKAILEYKIFDFQKQIFKELELANLQFKENITSVCDALKLKNNELLDLKIQTLSLFFDNLIDFEERYILNKEDFSYFFKNFSKILNEEEKNYKNKFSNGKINGEQIVTEIDFQNQMYENNLSIRGFYAPFSIHNMTKLGFLYNAQPGVWFSDPKAIKIIKEIFLRLNLFDNKIGIISSDEGVVSEYDIIQECFEEVKCYNDCSSKTQISKYISNIAQKKSKSEYGFELEENSNIDHKPFCSNNKYHNIDQLNNKSLVENQNNTSNCTLGSSKNYKDLNDSPHICLSCLEKLKAENKFFENEYMEFNLPCESYPINRKIYSDINEIKYDSEDYNNSNKDLCSRRVYKIKKAGFIFVSVRLGIDLIDKEYHDAIKRYFKIYNNLGIIGGKSYSAFYFIGSYEDKLIYLDPHLSQKSIENISSLYESGYKTYEPEYIYHLDIKNMSPGFSMGFYFRDVKEYKTLKESINANLGICKPSLFSFEKIDSSNSNNNEKKYSILKKRINLRPEDLKYTEVMDDDFSLITLEEEDL